MTKFVKLILLFTLVTFQINTLAQNLPTGAIAEINVGEGPVNAITYSRSANRIAIATANNIHIYDADTYEEIMVFVGHTDSVLAVAFSPNSKLLVSGSSDETVSLWNADTGELIRTREEHTGPVNAVAFTPNGERFWSAGNEDGAICSWHSIDGGEDAKMAYMPTDVFTATAFSFGGETSARAFDSFSDEAIVKAFSKAGRKVEGGFVRLTGIYQGGHSGFISTEHTDSVNVLALYASGKTVVTGSADKTIQLWNIEDLWDIEDTDPTKLLHTLTGHAGGITAMDFSVNGKLLASGSTDKTVRLWDVATGQHLHSLTRHAAEIRAVAFLGDKALAGTASARDKALASGSSDGTVLIWGLDEIMSND